MATKEQQIKNTFIYLLPLGVGNLIPLVTLPIFTRLLTKEDYGVFALAQVYAIFMNGLVNFGMTAAYDRNFFQYKSNCMETAKLLYSILLFVMLNFIFFAGLTYLCRGTFSKLIIGSAKHGNILFWAFCGQFFYTISYYYLAYFKNSETARNFVVYTIAVSLINFVISLFLVAYLRIGVIGIVYAQLCAGAMVFCLLSYKFTTFLPVSLNKAIFYSSLRIAYPLTPRIFFGVIDTQFNKYMIGLLASVGGVGIYSIGQSVSYVIFVFMTAIQNVFSPQTYQRMFALKEKGGEAIGKYLTPFAYVCISFAVFVSLFSEEVLSILTPPSFHGAIDIVIILSMYYGVLFFGKLTGVQLIFTKKTHLTSLLTMISIGIGICLNIPFIMKWGAVGAAWGTLLAGLFSGLISFIVAQHYYEIKWEYKKVGAIYLVFFASALLLITLRDCSADYGIRLFMKAIALASYAYLGIRFRIISKENIFMLKNIFFSKKALVT